MSLAADGAAVPATAGNSGGSGGTVVVVVVGADADAEIDTKAERQ